MEPIVIDDREQAAGLPEAVGEILGRRPEVRRLTLGDVSIGKATIVERKEVHDFVASILDGRLERQVAALLAAPARPVILIEGSFNKIVLGGMAPEAVRQVILTILLDRGIPVVRTRDLAHTAQWIVSLARHPSAPGRKLGGAFQPEALPGASGPVSHRRPRRPAAKGPQARQEAALKRIPGLGPSKARTLVDHFGSIHAMKGATAEELATAAGIGPALARAIRETLRRQT